MPRDRDEHGRPRQARPRDALGRPLPYGATGVPDIAEDPLPAAETIALALELLDAGRPFAAHEVFEVRWKTCPAGERDYWQGLAQVCAGFTQAARGNARGGDRLVERGVRRIASHVAAGGHTYGDPLAQVLTRGLRWPGSPPDLSP